MSVVVEFFGPMACFTQPALKVDRLSYPVPTPSGACGMISSIYCKPKEFWWSVRKIEVLNPIRYMPCKLNEITRRMNPNDKAPIDVTEYRTQRSTTFLRDVRYRITADIRPQRGFEWKLDQLVDQAERRIRKGQCFRQPYLGTSNCIGYFCQPDMSRQPIPVTKDYGIMVYGTHVPYDNRVGVSEADVSLYHCVMTDGVIVVPDYDDSAVFKMPRHVQIGGGAHA